MEALKINDLRNSSGAVDLDAVLDLALQKYRVLIGATQEYVKDIFNACDVKIGYNSFLA